MSEEEELLCKVIKCSYQLVSQAESIVSVQAAVPDIFDMEKMAGLVEILEKARRKLHAAGF